MQVKKQQLELDIKQWTGSTLGKEYIKAVYCYSAYLTCMQSTSCEMPGWMKHKLKSRLWGEIAITLDMPPQWQNYNDYRVEVRNRFKGLDLIECLMNYGWRFMTLYRRQESRPSPRKRNAKKQNGCLRRRYK